MQEGPCFLRRSTFRSSWKRWSVTRVGHTFVPWCMQVQALGTQMEQLQKRVIEVERERGLFFRHMEELRRHSTTLQEDNGRLLAELTRLRQAIKQVGSVRVPVKRGRRAAMPWRVRIRAGVQVMSCNASRHSPSPLAPVLTELAALRQAMPTQLGLSGSAWQLVAVASSGQ